MDFDRWARREGVTDAMLRTAAAEIAAGLMGARLGGSLLKKRVAAAGRGKRGSYRTIVAFRHSDRLVFLYGFAKNERDNISDKERKALIKLGDQYLGYDDATLTKLLELGLVLEVR